MDLAELIAALAKHKPADIAAALPRGEGTVFQHIFQQGFDNRHAKAEADEKALKAELDAAQKAKQKAEGELEDFRKKTPDVAQLVSKHEDEKREMAAKHKAELEKRDQAVEEANRTRALADLEVMLTNPSGEVAKALGGKKLVPAYAKVLLQDAGLRSRIRPKADGGFDLYAQDGKTPLVGKDGRATLDLLAQELVKGADATFVLVASDSGSGVEGSGGGSAGSGFYDKLRQEVQGNRNQPQPPANQNTNTPNVPSTGAGRLGVAPPVM